jgi:hypothetical protein
LLHLLVAIRLVPEDRSWRRAAISVALLWLVISVARIHPHYLAYFNELIGGPARGYRVLVESSLDWGQSLPALADYLHERGDPPAKIAYYGPERPSHYGIAAERLEGCQPVSGVVAISANVLRGLYSIENPFARPPEGCYEWLSAYEPVATPGYSILVYDIPSRQ